MNEQKFSERGICPSCGRYVGNEERCPYCGAKIPGRVSIRILKIAAVFGSIVGLVFLYIAAKLSQPRLIKISEITETMNFARVRVRGVVAGYPVFDERTQRFSFWVDDGTGRLMVVAFRKTALAFKDRLPSIGDIADVTGSLKVTPNFVSLIIVLPSKVKFEKPEVLPISVAELSKSYLFKVVKVRGRVRRVKAYEDFVIFDIVEKGKSQRAYFKPQFLPLPTPVAGSLVEAVGVLLPYKKKMTLYLRDLKILKRASPYTKIASLSIKNIGQTFTLKGKVVDYRKIRGGILFTITDGTGYIKVVKWKKYPSLRKGARVIVKGKLQEYRGELELKAWEVKVE